MSSQGVMGEECMSNVPLENTQQDNTSGQGAGAPVPAELRGWNWGAFLLNWIWGLGNNTFIALLMFVPVVNLVMPFVLGAKGNTWAWRNTRWRDVAHFRSVQRVWAIVAVLVYVIGIALVTGVVMLVLSVLKGSEAYQLSAGLLRHDSVMVAVFGTPIETGFPSGSIKVSGARGKAELSYAVSGPKAEGTAYVEATKANSQWRLEHLEVRVAGQSQGIVLVPAPPID